MNDENMRENMRETGTESAEGQSARGGQSDGILLAFGVLAVLIAGGLTYCVLFEVWFALGLASSEDWETLFDAPLRETGPVFGLLFFKPFFSGALLLDGILLLGCSGTKKRKTAAILYVLLLIGTAAGVVGVGGYLIFSCVVGDYKLIPWDYGIVAGAAVCLLLLIFAAVRAKKRAAARKEEAAEEIGRTGQTPKSA